MTMMRVRRWHMKMPWTQLMQSTQPGRQLQQQQGEATADGLHHQKKQGRRQGQAKGVWQGYPGAEAHQHLEVLIE